MDEVLDQMVYSYGEIGTVRVVNVPNNVVEAPSIHVINEGIYQVTRWHVSKVLVDEISVVVLAKLDALDY